MWMPRFRFLTKKVEVKSHENSMHLFLETIQYVRNPSSPNAKNQEQLSVLQYWHISFNLLIILGSVAFNSSSQLKLASDSMIYIRLICDMTSNW